MNSQVADTPTITITPEGAAPGAGTKLAQASPSDLQSMERELANYQASENSLINASAELLSVCGTLSRLKPGEEINSTRTELARAIIDLKYKVVRLDYPPSVAENLCLLYAIVVDEFVLLRPWATESGWENRTLVADLFGFRDGGDRFYNIADRALMQPKVLHEFLEIVYIFLKLGYRGKYNKSGEHERDRVIDRIETSLNLVPTESVAVSSGRDVKKYRPPGRVIATGTKIFIAAFIVAAITFGLVGLRAQTERTLLAEFQEKRTAAEAGSQVDFVFSSETGTLEAVPRQ
ncbi:type IVB secretion system protein IcmH/DotU [Cognatiyoonia sp. IB215446]|uniref:type IVB secretion system protein IcmH/DotU n=1 Tax=Cognatiyoonia sp. IB215446 TaxID=3097355 RepID=UPI002A10F142|nr:type IVB secretion system protein IcmH/DotU [Cognatiyoonia sp. IB215446]MDX8349801.1 type IVB secretion system protein IcmH/DotU [Cognatiyoonia sp. IB215446]